MNINLYQPVYPNYFLGDYFRVPSKFHKSSIYFAHMKQAWVKAL